MEERDARIVFGGVAFGFLLSAIAFAGMAVYGILASLGCNGTDASVPPAPGSLGDRLCNVPAASGYATLALVAVSAPLAGGLLAARRTRWRPLAVGFFVGAAASGLIAAWVAVIVGSRPGAVVGGPALALLLALIALARTGRGR